MASHSGAAGAAGPPNIRVLVLDCGGITNPDCELGNDAVAAVMGVAPDDAQVRARAAVKCAVRHAWRLARSEKE